MQGNVRYLNLAQQSGILEADDGKSYRFPLSRDTKADNLRVGDTLEFTIQNGVVVAKCEDNSAVPAALSPDLLRRSVRMVTADASLHFSKTGILSTLVNSKRNSLALAALFLCLAPFASYFAVAARPTAEESHFTSTGMVAEVGQPELIKATELPDRPTANPISEVKRELVPVPSPPPLETSESSPVIQTGLISQGPIVMDWAPDVGGPEHNGALEEQSLNEALPRHIYLTRVSHENRELRIAWRVTPVEGDPYPAKPNLFGSEEYPTGQLFILPGQTKADIVIRTVSTGVPDWHRSFEVSLTDADTGRPVLDRNKSPISVAFGVLGDLKCAPGRSDLCDQDGPPEHDEPVTDTTAVQRAGFALLDLKWLTDDDQSQTAIRIRREILPTIMQAGNIKGVGLEYLSTDLAGGGKPDLVVKVHHAVVCRPECPYRVYSFDGLAWRQLFDIRGALIATKRFAHSTSEIAVLHDRSDGTVTDFFRWQQGQYKLYRKVKPSHRRTVLTTESGMNYDNR